MSILKFGEMLRGCIEVIQEKKDLSEYIERVNKNYGTYIDVLEELLDANEFTEEQKNKVFDVAHSGRFKSDEARFIAIMKYLNLGGEYKFFCDKKCINFNYQHINCKICNELNRLCDNCYEKAKLSGGKDRRHGDNE